MPTVGDTAKLDDHLIAQALEFYSRRLLETPLNFRPLPAELVLIAHGLADRDWRRMEILDPRTILVHNRPVW